MILYDCEIVKAIQGRDDALVSGIEYCSGWRDFKGMGVSVIGAYDYAEMRYRVFLEDNFEEFQTLVNRTDLVIGFNNQSFDDQLCLAAGLHVPESKSWDLLVELWAAADLDSKFSFPSHVGFSQGAVCEANLEGVHKTGEGAMAPILWQQGKKGKVIDYCLNDVWMLKGLVDKVVETAILVDPRDDEPLYLDASRLELSVAKD